MDEDYTFQPQLNSRSRRLARHAPSLRERQEHEERLRRSASRESPGQRSSRGPGHPSSSPKATTPSQPPASSYGGAVRTDDGAVESVWALWRAVASGEGRAAERVYLSVDAPSSAAAAPTPPPLPRPPVVYVTTILAMLHTLGIRPPQHAALMEKFLLALGVQSEEDGAATEVVEAERFAHVFATVWNAAVTNRTRWSPAPARGSAAPGVPPVLQRTQRLARLPTPASAQLLVRSAEPASDGCDGHGALAADTPSAPSSSSSVSEASESLAAGDGPESTAALSRSASAESSSDPPSSCDEGACESHSGDVGESESVSSEDGSFLHRNMSCTSSPGALQYPDTKFTQYSPLSNEDTPGLSLSPEPRDPQKSPAAHTTSHAARYSRSPFSTTPAPLRSSTSSSMRRVQMPSTTRPLPSDSHLLTSTASCERKKATKRVPGGLMRECTFKPQINDAPLESHLAAAGGFEAESAAAARRRGAHVDAAPTFQPNTQQFHRERAKLAWWTERSADKGAQHTTNLVPEAGGGGASPVPMAPGFDTAVRRMIAARKKQQQQQQQTAEVPKRQSAVRKAEAPLLYVDVDLPRGETDRIALFRGADVAEVARAFCVQHELGERLCRRLEDILHTQLQAFA